MAFNLEATLQQVRIRRRILTDAMGGKCMDCGATEALEFHHTEKREWVAASLSQWQRMARYERDYIEGRLELLCSDCNKEAGVPVDAEEAANAVPF